MGRSRQAGIPLTIRIILLCCKQKAPDKKICIHTTQGQELILRPGTSSYPAPKNPEFQHKPRSHNFCIRTTRGHELIQSPGTSSYPAPKKQYFSTNQGVMPASWDQLVPCPKKYIRHKPRSHNFCRWNHVITCHGSRA